MAALSDMGGRPEHFGPVTVEPDEPVFHHPWEGRVFGMNVYVQTLLGPPNIDAGRFRIEKLPPEIYMASYYQGWLGGLESELADSGYLTPAEVEARMHGRPATAAPRRGLRMRRALTKRMLRFVMRPTLPRWLAAHVLPRVLGASRPALSRRRFSIGDQIRVRDEQHPGHTRQPGYVSGKRGVVTAHLGATLFPDAHAEHMRARPQHLYTVAFEGSELWGESAEPGTEVRIDLYEPYLVAA